VPKRWRRCRPRFYVKVLYNVSGTAWKKKAAEERPEVFRGKEEMEGERHQRHVREKHPDRLTDGKERQRRFPGKNVNKNRKKVKKRDDTQKRVVVNL